MTVQVTLTFDSVEEMLTQIGHLSTSQITSEGSDGESSEKAQTGQSKQSGGNKSSGNKGTGRGRGRPKKSEQAEQSGESTESSDSQGAGQSTGGQGNQQPEQNEQPMLTLDDARSELKKLHEAHGMDAAKAVLSDAGYVRVSELPEDKVYDFVQAVRAKHQELDGGQAEETEPGMFD